MADQGLGLTTAGMGQREPDELLAQIKSLLDEYLASGSQTPVAPEAQQLSQAIDDTLGGAGQLGAMNKDAGPDPMGGMDMGGGMPPVDDAGGPEPPTDLGMPADDAGGPEPPPSDSKTFEGARPNAEKRLKNRNKKTKA